MSIERELKIIKYKNARIEELVNENARLTARVEELEAEISKLRAACEAAQVFVHCNSLLCEYGNHADLCKQLRAALEGEE